MKMRKWIAILIILLTFIPFSVRADDKDLKVSPRNVESGGIKLDSQVYDYGQYEAVTHIKDSWNPFSSETLDKAFNQTANFFFSLTKIVASLIDTAIDKLYSLSLIDNVADQIADVSEMVYDNLYESLGVLLVTVAVLQIFFYYSAGRSSMKAGRTTLTLLAVIGVSMIWFSNAGYYLKTMNGLSNEVQGVIMRAGIPLAGDKVTKGEELKGSLAILRNSYFNLVVKKSYLIMNYGTPDEKELTKDDKKDENRITDLLEYKTDKEGYKKRAEIAEKEADELKNAYMSPSTLSEKIGITFCSFLFSLILGIPLLVLAFLNVGIQILILAFSIILGVSLLIAILPNFSNSGWKNFERVAGMFITKAFIGLAILFIFVLVQLMERFIPPLTANMYMLNIIATAASMFVTYKFRDKIIDVATGGRITSLDGGALKQVYEKGVKQPASKVTALTKKAVSGVAGVVGGPAANKAKERVANRSTQGVQDKAQRNVQKPTGETNKEAKPGKTPVLSRLRKKAVNLPANMKDKAQTAKEAITEDLPLNAKHTAAKVKHQAKQAKDNVVNLPKRVRNTLQEDRREGEAGRQANQEARQQRRQQKQSEIKEFTKSSSSADSVKQPYSRQPQMQPQQRSIQDVKKNSVTAPVQENHESQKPIQQSQLQRQTQQNIKPQTNEAVIRNVSNHDKQEVK
ncbi:TrbL/VirB6 plasmid conjugal transfer protein [Bacillus pseudomycoides]